MNLPLGAETRPFISYRWTSNPLSANTKHVYNICTMLDQRRRRWADVLQILYKCFVFAGWHDYSRFHAILLTD